MPNSETGAPIVSHEDARWQGRTESRLEALEKGQTYASQQLDKISNENREHRHMMNNKLQSMELVFTEKLQAIELHIAESAGVFKGGKMTLIMTCSVLGALGSAASILMALFRK